MVSPDKRAAEAVQRAFLQASSVCFLLYRNIFAGPAHLLVPDHTRDAFFQLFCDLRTNSPKDRKWLERHATALNPRTVTGWLALTSSLLFLTASVSLLVFTTTCALVGMLYVLMSLVAIAVVLSGAVLSAVAGVLLVVACLAGFVATAVAWGYVGLSTPGALVGALRQLQGQPVSRRPAERRARPTQPVSKSLAQPEGDLPPASSNSSTGVSSSDANLGAANPAAANMNYVEELSPQAGSASGLPGTQHSSNSRSSPYQGL